MMSLISTVILAIKPDKEASKKVSCTLQMKSLLGGELCASVWSLVGDRL